MNAVSIRAASWQNQQNDLCAQRKLRSAWASAQSDQRLCCPCEETWALNYLLSAQWRLWSDWADAQADLSLCWEHMSFCWFCCAAAHIVCHSHCILWTHFSKVKPPCWKVITANFSGVQFFWIFTIPLEMLQQYKNQQTVSISRHYWHLQVSTLSLVCCNADTVASSTHDLLSGNQPEMWKWYLLNMKTVKAPVGLCIHVVLCHRSTVWLSSSVGRMQEVLGSSSSQLYAFPPMTFGGTVWVHARAASNKGLSCQFWHGSQQIWRQILCSRGNCHESKRVAL